MIGGVIPATAILRSLGEFDVAEPALLLHDHQLLVAEGKGRRAEGRLGERAAVVFLSVDYNPVFGIHAGFENPRLEAVVATIAPMPDDVLLDVGDPPCFEVDRNR